MNILSSFLIVALVSISSAAQSLKVVSGKVIGKDELDGMSINYRNFVGQELDGRSRSNYFIDTTKKVFTIGIARDADKQYRFGILKDYITLTGSKVMQVEIPGVSSGKYSINKLIALNGRRFIFYTTKVGDEENLYVNQLDDNMVVLGSPIKLISQSKKFQNTSIHVSSDKRSLLVFQSGVGDVDDDKSAFANFRENQGISCTLFDEQFSKVWATENELPFRPMKGSVTRIEVDNDRNMYFLTSTGKDKDQKASLYQYYWHSNEWKQTPLGGASQRTYGCELQVLNGTVPVVAGISGSGKRNGYFAIVVDVAGQTAKQVINKPFPAEYSLGHGFIWPEHYSVSNIVMTANGNITFSFEGASVTTSAHNSSVHYYQFSPVFVKQISREGKEIWQRVIHKQQTMQYIPNGGGHALFSKENDVIVFYNDHADNAKLGTEVKKTKMYTRVKTILVAQRIDITGKATKELVVAKGADPYHSFDPRVMIPLQKDLYLTEFWQTEKAGSWTFSYATVQIP